MQQPFTVSGPVKDYEAIRVLHCIPTLAAGGAETQLRLLAPHLAARGLNVAIIGRITAADAATLSEQGVTCFPLGSRGNYSPKIITALFGAVRALRPAVVQTWLPQMDILGGAITSFYGIPWIITERSSPLAYPASAKNSLRRWLGSRATLVANSSHGLDSWPRHADAQVIGNGIDLAAVADVPRGLMKNAEPFRGRTTVVSMSRLVPEKGVDVLIAAIDIARRSIPNVRLVVVGDGPERENLETLAVKRGLADHVVFTGFRAAPVEWIRSADMFASASLFEGHPNAVTEAAAAGVPMILSDIAMHRSLMNDGALYASRSSASTFAQHIVGLAREPALCEILVAAGHRAIEHFDIDTIAARYLTLYQRVIAEAANRNPR